MRVWIGYIGNTLYWSRSINTLISYGVEGISPDFIENLLKHRR